MERCKHVCFWQGVRNVTYQARNSGRHTPRKPSNGQEVPWKSYSYNLTQLQSVLWTMIMTKCVVDNVNDWACHNKVNADGHKISIAFETPF